jgi:hypothetical protein
VRIAFVLEALELPGLLGEFTTGFDRFRNANAVSLGFDEIGNPYPLVLEYLAIYVATLSAATSNPAQLGSDLPRLERILQGTPRLISDRGIEPCKESEVRRVLYQTLIHFFPDTVREVPIAKVSKTYKPDIGIRTLKAAVEFKFCASEEELKRAIGGVFEDVSGYAGSEDWQNFYAVFYITDHFMTQAQAEADFNLSRVDRRWKPLLVHGHGARRKVRTANKTAPPGGSRRR